MASENDCVMPNPLTARGEARLSARRVKTRLKAVAAIQLRTTGAPFRQIASSLGISVSEAHRLIGQELDRRCFEALDLLRAVELEKLRQLEQILAPKVQRGHLGSMDRLLKVMEHRCRLVPGLRVPDGLVDMASQLRRHGQIVGWSEQETERAIEMARELAEGRRR